MMARMYKIAIFLLGRIFGSDVRRAMSQLTLWGWGAVAFGALIGPAQVGASMIEMASG